MRFNFNIFRSDQNQYNMKTEDEVLMRSPSRGLPSPSIKQDNIDDSKVYRKNE